MFKWLKKLVGIESGKSERVPVKNPRTSEIFVSPPPPRTSSTVSTSRPVQTRQHLNRAASPAPAAASFSPGRGWTTNTGTWKARPARRE